MRNKKLLEELEAIRDEMQDIVMGFNYEKNDLNQTIAKLQKALQKDSETNDSNTNKGGTQKQDLKPENDEFDEFFNSSKIEDDEEVDKTKGKDKKKGGQIIE